MLNACIASKCIFTECIEFVIYIALFRYTIFVIDLLYFVKEIQHLVLPG